MTNIDAKLPSALRTIGEVAMEVDVATHVLRFWEGKFSNINPQKRRGRRYYSISDIATIKTIKHLLYDQGYTINGVSKFLKNPSSFGATSEVTANNVVPITAPTQGLTANDIMELRNIYNGLCVARGKLLKRPFASPALPGHC